MSTFALDASVTLAWLFEDESTAFTVSVLDRLATSTAVVPAIWAFEVANVAILSERRRRISAAQRTGFLELLGCLPIAIEPVATDRVWSAVIDLAQAQGLTAYDAAYLEVAARTGLALATSDGDLAAAATRVGVTLLRGQ